MKRYLTTLLAAALTLAAASCSSSPQESCTPKSCAELNAECDVDDGCGGIKHCGTCGAGLACNAGKCQTCAPDTDAATCSKAGPVCGLFHATDNCGNVKDLDCGSCTVQGEVCTVEGKCVACGQDDDATFCSKASRECDNYTGTDNCNVQRTVNCGSCESPKTCNAQGRCGECTAETDQVFCQNHSAECGDLYDVDRCGNPMHANCGDCSNKPGTSCDGNICSSCVPDCTGRACGPDGCGGECMGICDIGMTCNPNTGVCESPSAGNDSCTSPQNIKLTTGSATVNGDLSTSTNDYEGGCGGGTGKDLVYMITLNEAKKVIITVSPDTVQFAPIVYLRSACAKASSEQGCSSGDIGAPATLLLANLEAGTYYLVVDSAQGTGSSFSLTVDTSAPAAAPANDACAGAVALVKNTSVQGTTSLANDDIGPTEATFSTVCAAKYSQGIQTGGGSRPDVFFTYTPATAGNFTVNVAGTAPYQPTVWVGTATACAALSGASCLDVQKGEYPHTNSASVTVANATASTLYYIVVDTAALASSNQSGNFSIVVQ